VFLVRSSFIFVVALQQLLTCGLAIHTSVEPSVSTEPDIAVTYHSADERDKGRIFLSVSHPRSSVMTSTTPTSTNTMSLSSPSTTEQPSCCLRRDDETKRFIFEYNGRSIYEWEQSLDEVVIHVPAPPSIKANLIHCKISAQHLQLGMKGSNQYIIDERTFGKIDIEESTWTLENGNVVLYLQKANKGLVWETALLGRTVGETTLVAYLDPYQLEQVKQELLLERWQAENPGMDFRNATFNNGGGVPDPRTYMGGVKYD